MTDVRMYLSRKRINLGGVLFHQDSYRLTRAAEVEAELEHAVKMNNDN